MRSLMNPKFGPRAQTREQRQALFNQAAAINATQGAFMEPFAVELSKRYISGECTMQEVLAEVKKVHQARYQAQMLPIVSVVDTVAA